VLNVKQIRPFFYIVFSLNRSSSVKHLMRLFSQPGVFHIFGFQFLSLIIRRYSCFCSLWDYTDVVMNYLCGPYISDLGSSHKQKWLEYFDVVITGRSESIVAFFSLIYD
jgi:hypothetical protein